jgi:uncharacterized protein YjeT (DUF2065 family)
MQVDMKKMARYSGAILMGIGILILIGPLFIQKLSNTTLTIGMILIIEGFLGYIYVNNMKKGTKLSNIVWGIILLGIPFLLFYYAKKKAYSDEEITLFNEELEKQQKLWN